MKSYEITTAVKGDQNTMKIDASSIIAALEKAHKILQIDWGIPRDGYRIAAAAQFYRDATNREIRSDYPVPGGPNPDMWEITGKIKPVELTTGKNS